MRSLSLLYISGLSGDPNDPFFSLEGMYFLRGKTRSDDATSSSLIVRALELVGQLAWRMRVDPVRR